MEKNTKNIRKEIIEITKEVLDFYSSLGGFRERD